MLRNSFIHLPGIGEKTERRLWQGGLTEWGGLRSFPADSLKALSVNPRRRDALAAMLDESGLRFAASDARYFAERMPTREVWRLFGDFHAGAAYLDIETNGFDRVTAVVVHRDGQTLLFARDENLHELPMHLAGVKLLVTYNGRSFDWPILQRTFANLPEPAAHLDLRYPFGRLDLKFRGGLKGIEKAIGCNRPGELQDIDGWSAVWLWRRHRRGDPRALPALLRYCAEDVLNLKFLAEWVYNELAGPLPVNAELFATPTRAACDTLPQADSELMNECRRQTSHGASPEWA